MTAMMPSPGSKQLLSTQSGIPQAWCETRTTTLCKIQGLTHVWTKFRGRKSTTWKKVGELYFHFLLFKKMFFLSLFLSFFEMGSHWVVLIGLELPMWTRLAMTHLPLLPGCQDLLLSELVLSVSCHGKHWTVLSQGQHHWQVEKLDAKAGWLWPGEGKQLPKRRKGQSGSTHL